MDTIAAISTGVSPAAIGIVRISGGSAKPILQQCFSAKTPAPVKPGVLTLGWLTAPNGQKIDQILAVFFVAPKSYTGEDLVELQCHGSPAVLRKALEMVLGLGARLAEPGEFTKRAVLARKMTLPEAEAAGALIAAQSEGARAAAMEVLAGGSEALRQIMDDITFLRSEVQAAIDYPEEISPPEERAKRLQKIIRELAAEIKTASRRQKTSSGISVLISGPPNVGKSSLFNALLGRSEAIVTDIPGTTRDLLKQSVVVDGIQFNLIDSAGVRKTAEPVEAFGVERAIAARDNADIILQMSAAGEAPEASAARPKERLVKVINIINKIDLLKNLPSNFDQNTIAISVKEKIGLDDLVALLTDAAENIFDHATPTAEANARQSRHLLVAKRALEDAASDGETLEFVQDALTVAESEMAAIFWEETPDSLDAVFANFCVGK